jgi:hypothetical protein
MADDKNLLGEDEKKNLDLFGNEDLTDTEKEWQDMPEFLSEDEKVYAKIVLRFDTKEELDYFSQLIGQKVGRTTRGIKFGHVKQLNEIKDLKGFKGMTHNFQWVVDKNENE